MKSLDVYWRDINAISLLLLPVSALFCLLSKLRLQLYKQNILKSYKAPVPVLVVGNISVGGTGKTPLIIELVKQLQSQGRTPGVISRGYGGRSRVWPRVVNANSTADQVGDEPELIYQHTQCPLVVGPHREQSIKLLLEQFNCDVLLSDDGMQHYAMQRDIEIAVVDAQRQFGNGFCLPAGPLRETTSRLNQVDLVLYNGGDSQQNSFSMRATHCLAVGRESDRVDLVRFSGQKLHAIAGIGNPQRFFDMLKRFGIDVIEHPFPDHHQFSEANLLFNDAMPVLMTEKDAVKCRHFKLSDHWAVSITIDFSDDAQTKLDRIFNSLPV
ncbi:Tetraacyldisaccharide 4'-kinase [hydrothermal vent metagenome]|uniref:tetraacyldisaccharide 4'-kinase n=1 Tax=hydrothermal vent metagenome TaxID=652676 RepID=A0A3B0XFM3_9ZZZZ